MYLKYIFFLNLTAFLTIFNYSTLAETTIEAKEYSFNLTPGDSISAGLKCTSGRLISGGVNVDNSRNVIRVDESYPTRASGIDYWRGGVINIGNNQLAGTWDIIISCYSETSVVAQEVIRAESILLQRVTHQAPDHNGNMTDVTDIFTVLPDGLSLTQITTSPVNQDWDEAEGSFSPDGTKIAFASYRHRDNPLYGNTSEIYVMSSDGTGQIRLTSNRNLYDDGPRWCDGSTLVYSQAGFIMEMLAQDGDGDGQGDQMEMLVDHDETVSDYYVDCSQDGTKILFSRDFGNGSNTIFIANRDGTNLVSLTNTIGRNITPRFSPTGNRIAFASNRDNPITFANDIYIMDSTDNDMDGEGDNIRRLTLSGAFSTSENPVWSPSGNQVAFSQTVGANSTIHIVDDHGLIVSPPLLAVPPNAFATDWQ